MRIKLKRDGCRCNKCGHQWAPRPWTAKPLICPRCKTARWDLPQINNGSRRKVKRGS